MSDDYRPDKAAAEAAREQIARQRLALHDLLEENARLERILQAPLSLKAHLETAWEAAEQADECRKGDVLIVRHRRGEYTILEAEGVLQLATTARVLSRAPQREPWQDLADVLSTDNGELIGEHRTITEVAKALHERGVRVVGGDDDE